MQQNIKKLKFYKFNCVDSTNIIARRLATDGAEEGTVVTAKQQTAGKGRLGRTFLSEKGGVYFSVVLRPQITPEEMLFITTAAAVAAARAIESVSGKKCEIKWVNDIYINGKKVCGILTEGEFNTEGKLEYAILGVGINLFMPKGCFPSDIPLAGSVFEKGLFKNRIKTKLVSNFLSCFFEFYKDLHNKPFICEYRNRSLLDGKEITYTKNGETHLATVVEIDENARLVVKNGQKTTFLSTGEVQLTEIENLFKDKK